MSSFSTFLPQLEIKNTNAQTFSKVISFPEINVTSSNNNQFTTLKQEFLLVGDISRSPVEILNHHFSLSTPFITLFKDQKYVINPPNNEDIKYTNASIKLAQVIFVSPDIKKEDADPENPADMTLANIMDLGSSAARGNGFVLPSNISHGDYILYVYLQYPYDITAVFSNLVKIGNMTANSVQQ